MLIKKIGLMALVMSVGVSSAFAASSATSNKWYAGADVQYNHLKADKDLSAVRLNGKAFDMQENLLGVSLFGGYRWDFLGAELGLTGFNTHKYNGTFSNGVVSTNGQIKQRNGNVYLDGIYYHALTHNFDLKALVGVGYLNTQLKGTSININENAVLANGSANHSSGRLGVRLGVGGQYNFNECWSTSLMYKFQTGNKYVKNMQTVAAGFAYHF